MPNNAGKHWIPWQLSPDSDSRERWILVNADDDGEEHPGNMLYNSEQEARDADAEVRERK